MKRMSPVNLEAAVLAALSKAVALGMPDDAIPDGPPLAVAVAVATWSIAYAWGVDR